MRKAIQSFIERLEDRRNPSTERSFEKLKASRTAFRQAVAQTIATEQQIAQQLEKNQNQAKVWESRALKAESDDLQAQSLMRRKQYAEAADLLSIELAAYAKTTASLRMRLFDVERPVQLVWLVKSLLAVFPEDSKAPKELRDQLKELFSLIRQLITEIPPKDIERKKSDDFYPKMFGLLERSLTAFPIFSSYYQSHPKDPEAEKFKERATAFYKKIAEATEKDRKNHELFSTRLKEAEAAKNEELIQRALAYVIEYGYFLPHYEKVTQVLSTVVDKKAVDDEIAKEKSEAAKKPNASTSAQAHPSWKKKKKRKR